MAFTFTKEPEGVYPAYNDSYIEFTSSLADNVYAEVSATPSSLFPNVFKIFPDADGVYLMNLKEIVKVVFNQNGFKDSNYFVDAYWKSITDILLLQIISIEVFSASTSETTGKGYDFFKAVKQIAEPVHSNVYQLLMYSADGEAHSMSYFEGFPFHFDILEVEELSEVIVKNLNTGNSTVAMAQTETDSFRVLIDKGEGNNWTSDAVLVLEEGLNNLEVKIDTVVKSTLSLYKKVKCSGIYLKWWNRSGGFSHYLFDEYYIDQTKGSENGMVMNSDFDNIQDAIGLFKSTGKKALQRLVVKATYQDYDYENLRDIFRSPLVQMFTATEADAAGTFIDVSVEGNIAFSNKRGSHKVTLVIELPETQTAKL